MFLLIAGIVDALAAIAGAADRPHHRQPLRVRRQLQQALMIFVAHRDSALVLRIRRPPQFNAPRPLRGLRIRVDPGHGGRDTATTGPTGWREAHANLAISLAIMLYLLFVLLNDGGSLLTRIGRFSPLPADEITTFWKVTIPQLWPGILSGALLAFTMSFDDFVITFFTAGVGFNTLPLQIYSMIKVPYDGEMIALQAAIYRGGFASWLSPMTASLAFAVTFVLFWYVILDQLYRRGVFFKV